MHILIHDYAGHPFQFDLSRELAKRGHKVTHVYTSSSGGPKSSFDYDEKFPLDVINLEVPPIKKSNFVVRFFQERNYGERLVDLVNEKNPSIVISANTPLSAQNILHKWCKKHSVPFIFWLQDINSIATDKILKKKFGIFAKPISYYFISMEKNILNDSEHTIAITDDFVPILKDWGVDENKITVIPNWAPIDEIPVHEQNNSFSRTQGLVDKFVVLYSGTMGMKHNPELIATAAESMESEKDIVFVVISEGIGRNYLEEAKKKRNLKNLILLDFQPFGIFPKVLGSSDILLTILEPEAGIFSVPSKVLSGLCAQRPAILYVPQENLAAKIIERNNAGIVITDNSEFNLTTAIQYLQEHPDEAKQMGINAISYAQDNFKINRIADKFVEVINKYLNNY